MISSQPAARQPHLAACLEKLMTDVQRNLEAKNRDKFTQVITPLSSTSLVPPSSGIVCIVGCQAMKTGRPPSRLLSPPHIGTKCTQDQFLRVSWVDGGVFFYATFFIYNAK